MTAVMSFFDEELRKVDKELAENPAAEAFDYLQFLSPDLFALLTWRKASVQGLPHLSRHLLELPPASVQMRYVGGHGEALLPRTCFFINFLKTQIKSCGLSEPKILDYGCGWGRMTRLLPVLAPYANIYSVDPNRDVLKYLQGSDHFENVFHIDVCPQGMPFDVDIDLCFFFSVFTHIPPWTAQKILKAVAGIQRRGALLVVTIRPVEYWRYFSENVTSVDHEFFESEHHRAGYAFFPQGDNQNYGDISYSEGTLEELFKGYELIDKTFTILDPHQIYLTFKKM